jgi:hypothetical protein
MVAIARSVRALLILPVLVAILLWSFDWIVLGAIPHGHPRVVRIRCVVVGASANDPIERAIVHMSMSFPNEVTELFPKEATDVFSSRPTGHDGRTYVDVVTKCVDTFSLLGVTHNVSPRVWQLRVEIGAFQSDPQSLEDYAIGQHRWDHEIVVRVDQAQRQDEDEEARKARKDKDEKKRAERG